MSDSEWVCEMPEPPANMVALALESMAILEKVEARGMNVEPVRTYLLGLLAERDKETARRQEILVALVDLRWRYEQGAKAFNELTSERDLLLARLMPADADE